MKLDYWIYGPDQLIDVERHFGIEVPSVQDLYNNVAVVLVNSHPSVDGVRPMTPGVVEVGGLHVVDHDEDLSSVSILKKQ